MSCRSFQNYNEQVRVIHFFISSLAWSPISQLTLVMSPFCHVRFHGASREENLRHFAKGTATMAYMFALISPSGSP
jgi:hypothetical protein